MYEAALQWFGFGLCHQLPERSFFGGGVQVPVCARDTGIYVGVIVSVLMVAALQSRRPSRLPSRGIAVLLGAFVLVMVLDGLSAYAGLRDTTNAIRLATGLLAGYAVGALLVPLINEQLWRTSSSERIFGTRRSLALWLASIPVAFLCVLWGGPLLGAAYPLAVAIAILAALCAVNLVIVTLFPVFERRADRLADAWLPLMIATALSLVEVAASAGIKLWLTSVFS